MNRLNELQSQIFEEIQALASERSVATNGRYTFHENLLIYSQLVAQGINQLAVTQVNSEKIEQVLRETFGIARSQTESNQATDSTATRDKNS